ncbi:BrnA antitoxin family protein [Kaistia geumhonensis]|uniref:Uncharacterized protein (DUF4415 family) n=1 Tax=Kaistia geumhonensis TaxID=410839 RepID=A0ABU0M5C1_9HYPH|nr:BrnA antitoxin family protein [Kaistia geumhonensis]MCX5478641.1 BrnA antitoxin family protein [Kaistia geumhonensis]MDQ0516141.1 uncharacterized protein (DUF4415 family) [Kaistia geumhonensis]
MTTDRPRRPKDPFAAAEAMFAKKRQPDIGTGALPTAKELVSIRIDRDVVEHFQANGPGWQERMNAALRAAAIADGMDPLPKE